MNDPTGSTRVQLRLVLVLLLLGLAWGVTIPLSKITVSEGYRHFGVIFWETVIGAVLMGVLTYARGKTLPLGRKHVRLFVVLAIVGTIYPNAVFYHAAVVLPSGLLAIVTSLVPMFAFPMAVMMGHDRFSWRKMLGLCLGLSGVILIVAPPASLPDRAMVPYLLWALTGPLFYALEGNLVARWGTFDMDPLQVLMGMSLAGALMTLPLALATGQWFLPKLPLSTPDLTLITVSLLHAMAYATYVWLVGRAGPVFTTQVAYLVTLFGVISAMFVLGERYSLWIWAALAVMLAGLFLVQPRPNAPLAHDAGLGKDTSL